MREIKRKLMEYCDAGMPATQRQKYYSSYMEAIRGGLSPEKAIEHAEDKLKAKSPPSAKKIFAEDLKEFAGKPLTSNNVSKLTTVPKGKRDEALDQKRHQELFNSHIKEIKDKGATVKKLSVQDSGDCVYSDTDQGKLKSEIDSTSKVVHTWNPKE